MSRRRRGAIGIVPVRIFCETAPQAAHLGALPEVQAAAPLLQTHEGKTYDTVEDIVEHGAHLEHFHAYRREGATTDAKTIDVHADQGLFIAFTPPLTQGDEDLPARWPRGRGRRGERDAARETRLVPGGGGTPWPRTRIIRGRDATLAAARPPIAADETRAIVRPIAATPRRRRGSSPRGAWRRRGRRETRRRRGKRRAAPGRDV